MNYILDIDINNNYNNNSNNNSLKKCIYWVIRNRPKMVVDLSAHTLLSLHCNYIICVVLSTCLIYGTVTYYPT